MLAQRPVSLKQCGRNTRSCTWKDFVVCEDFLREDDVRVVVFFTRRARSIRNMCKSCETRSVRIM